MARETLHLVQAYASGRGKALKAEQAQQFKTPEAARRAAERLAPVRLGVVAYSITVDADLGEYDDTPTVLFKAGQLPPPFNED